MENEIRWWVYDFETYIMMIANCYDFVLKKGLTARDSVHVDEMAEAIWAIREGLA